MATFELGSRWEGFYDAPLPYGRQKFTLKVEHVKEEDNTFKAIGSDKDGKFTATGSLTNVKNDLEEDNVKKDCTPCPDIHFIKNYISEDGYKGIEYNGKLIGQKITGNYSFVWKKSFLSKTITGIFEMNLVRETLS